MPEQSEIEREPKEAILGGDPIIVTSDLELPFCSNLTTGVAFAIVEKTEGFVKRGLLYVPQDFKKPYHQTIDRFLTSFSNPLTAFRAIVHLPFIQKRTARINPTYQAFIGYLNIRRVQVDPANIEARFETDGNKKLIESKVVLLEEKCLNSLWYGGQVWLNQASPNIINYNLLNATTGN